MEGIFSQAVSITVFLEFEDAALAWDSSIRRTGEVGVPTDTQTQRKEVCVVDGDEGQAMKVRKLLGGNSPKESDKLKKAR